MSPCRKRKHCDVPAPTNARGSRRARKLVSSCVKRSITCAKENTAHDRRSRRSRSDSPRPAAPASIFLPHLRARASQRNEARGQQRDARSRHAALPRSVRARRCADSNANREALRPIKRCRVRRSRPHAADRAVRGARLPRKRRVRESARAVNAPARADYSESPGSRSRPSRPNAPSTSREEGAGRSE